jgi:hypothetical protein
MSVISRPEDLVEYLSTYIDSSTMNFQTIAKYDDNMIAGYPAVQITPGTLTKKYHGTHTFFVTINAILYVMHGDMSVSRSKRILEDLQLATSLVNWLEGGTVTPYSNVNSLQGNALNAWVESEVGAVLPPKSKKGLPVVSTRLVFCVENVIRFK